jgi:hypothetical protein
MLTFKQLIASVFLSKEIAALKTEAAEATAALDKIAVDVVGIAKEAPAEAHALAAKVLSEVLASADKVRLVHAPVVHAWAAKLYADYAASIKDTESVISKAIQYAKAAKIFIVGKL